MKSNNNLIKYQKTTKTSKTDWGSVAFWYDKTVKSDDSYQAKVILPNLLRILGGEKNIKDKNILDMACGSGYFSNILAEMGANIVGVDLGNELVKVAKENFEIIKNNNKDKNLFAKYFVGNAEEFLKVSDLKKLLTRDNFNLDFIICTLALQNIKDINSVVSEIKKITNKKTKVIFVINHPSFRIPQNSDWYFDDSTNDQGRVSYKYMSEIKIEMDMNPGETNKNKKIYTYSFHRPLQYYMKIFAKNGFVISALEEWISHKKSEDNAKRKDIEDNARKEIPLFMCVTLEVR